jgi:hypothetical protein
VTAGMVTVPVWGGRGIRIFAEDQVQGADGPFPMFTQAQAGPVMMTMVIQMDTVPSTAGRSGERRQDLFRTAQIETKILCNGGDTGWI